MGFPSVPVSQQHYFHPSHYALHQTKLHQRYAFYRLVDHLVIDYLFQPSSLTQTTSNMPRYMRFQVSLKMALTLSNSPHFPCLKSGSYHLNDLSVALPAKIIDCCLGFNDLK